MCLHAARRRRIEDWSFIKFAYVLFWNAYKMNSVSHAAQETPQEIEYNEKRDIYCIS